MILFSNSNNINSPKCFILGILSICILAGCSKKTINNEGELDLPSPIPVIEFLDINPETVQQFNDSFEITINYYDGDGDLGNFDPDILSVEVTDPRGPFIESFHIPPILPENADPASIQGVFTINIDRTILTNPGASSESTNFSVRIKDRANNWSNSILTSPIIIFP